MEISSKNNITNIDAYVNQVNDQQKTDTPSEKAEKNVAKTDTVAISQTAKEIHETRKQLEAVPDVRMDKVEELKAQIENGTYKRNSEEIAEKMLKESLFNDMV